MLFCKNSKNMRMNWSLYACSGHCFTRYNRHARIKIVFGTFAELQKATITCTMPVCLSVRTELGFHRTDFHEV